MVRHRLTTWRMTDQYAWSTNYRSWFTWLSGDQPTAMTGVEADSLFVENCRQKNVSHDRRNLFDFNTEGFSADFPQITSTFDQTKIRRLDQLT